MPNFSDWFGELAGLETASFGGLANVLLLAMVVGIASRILAILAKHMKERVSWRSMFMLIVFLFLLAVTMIVVLLFSLAAVGSPGIAPGM